jgi:hypothetical protein
VEQDPEYEQTGGFSTAELQILEFNLTERKVPGSTSDRVCMPANLYRDLYRSEFVCKPV